MPRDEMKSPILHFLFYTIAFHQLSLLSLTLTLSYVLVVFDGYVSSCLKQGYL